MIRPIRQRDPVLGPVRSSLIRFTFRAPIVGATETTPIGAFA